MKTDLSEFFEKCYLLYIHLFVASLLSFRIDLLIFFFFSEYCVCWVMLGVWLADRTLFIQSLSYETSCVARLGVFPSLKLGSTIFYQIFICPPNDSPSQTIANVFYFIEKTLFVLEIFKVLKFFPFHSILSGLRKTKEVE